MAKKAQLTESLPKLSVTPEMRRRVQAVADAAEVGMSDVVRDCIVAMLPGIELQLGLIDLDDLNEEDLARVDPWVKHEEELPEGEAPVAVPGTLTGWGPDRPRE
jgi:hypothetical protein